MESNTAIYEYTVGDHVVVRQDETGAERYGKVVEVFGSGAARVWLPKTKLFQREGCLTVDTNGCSPLTIFRIIKHVKYADFMATGRCNV